MSETSPRLCPTTVRYAERWYTFWPNDLVYYLEIDRESVKPVCCSQCFETFFLTVTKLFPILVNFCSKLLFIVDWSPTDRIWFASATRVAITESALSISPEKRDFKAIKCSKISWSWPCQILSVIICGENIDHWRITASD